MLRGWFDPARGFVFRRDLSVSLLIVSVFFGYCAECFLDCVLYLLGGPYFCKCCFGYDILCSVLLPSL